MHSQPEWVELSVAAGERLSFVFIMINITRAMPSHCIIGRIEGFQVSSSALFHDLRICLGNVSMLYIQF